MKNNHCQESTVTELAMKFTIDFVYSSNKFSGGLVNSAFCVNNICQYLHIILSQEQYYDYVVNHLVFTVFISTILSVFISTDTRSYSTEPICQMKMKKK